MPTRGSEATLAETRNRILIFGLTVRFMFANCSPFSDTLHVSPVCVIIPREQWGYNRGGDRATVSLILA